MTKRWPLIALSAAVAAVGVYKWRHSRTSPMSADSLGSNAGVDDASDDSFPASDAPSWTPVTGSSAQH